MKRVAVTYRFDDEVVPYTDALRSAGIEPVLVNPEQPSPSLNGLAGLLLSGGTDLNPALYHSARDPRTDDPDDELDRLEIALLAEALERDTPVLGICRGMQLFNVAHAGGSLAQHIEGHRGPPNDYARPWHDVRVAAGTELARILGPGEHAVNSRHHQAVGRTGSGLIVSAYAPDGIAEGLERADRRFAIAVQWHPENMAPNVDVQRRLFEAFGDVL